MELADEELPVLNEVVEAGDESVIRSTRFKLSDENLSRGTSSDIPQFELPARLKMDVLGAHRIVPQDSIELPNDDSNADLESKIDTIIDKHIVALRKELRNLLNSAE